MASLGPRLTAAGLLPGAAYIASPNCDERPVDAPVRLVVVHAISLPPGEFGGDGIERLFSNRLDPAAHPYYREIQALRVSAHFCIRRDGTVIQFVPTVKRAWHAGLSRWRECERCNDFSLGIELEGCDDKPFLDIQYIRLARLIRILRHAYAIEDIVGHADIAPGRKTDPGPCFDWLRLRRLLRRRAPR
ncbi:MAG TPA: 1,6-anhydro-N-acetylmuramyl-L-alanine amidase AmpD [Rhodocyclaceae bacterium]|nr:1,6-anhydro-N-acetylmuramyl-L-alanine amidase AmpD [Rhodocyclaceae bacterium]